MKGFEGSDLFRRRFWHLWAVDLMCIGIMKGFAFWVLVVVAGTALVLLSLSTEGSSSPVPGKFLCISCVCCSLNLEI